MSSQKRKPVVVWDEGDEAASIGAGGTRNSNPHHCFGQGELRFIFAANQDATIELFEARTQAETTTGGNNEFVTTVVIPANTPTKQIISIAGRHLRMRITNDGGALMDDWNMFAWMTEN